MSFESRLIHQFLPELSNVESEECSARSSDKSLESQTLSTAREFIALTETSSKHTHRWCVLPPSFGVLHHERDLLRRAWVNSWIRLQGNNIDGDSLLKPAKSSSIPLSSTILPSMKSRIGENNFYRNLSVRYKFDFLSVILVGKLSGIASAGNPDPHAPCLLGLFQSLLRRKE